MKAHENVVSQNGLSEALYDEFLEILCKRLQESYPRFADSLPPGVITEDRHGFKHVNVDLVKGLYFNPSLGDVVRYFLQTDVKRTKTDLIEILKSKEIYHPANPVIGYRKVKFTEEEQAVFLKKIAKCFNPAIDALRISKSKRLSLTPSDSGLQNAEEIQTNSLTDPYPRRNPADREMQRVHRKN